MESVKDRDILEGKVYDAAPVSNKNRMETIYKQKENTTSCSIGKAAKLITM